MSTTPLSHNNTGDKDNGVGGGGSDDELGADWDDKPLDIADVPTSKSADNYFVAPRPGPDTDSIWCSNSKFAADHAAAGSFESAMEVKRKNFPYFINNKN